MIKTAQSNVAGPMDKAEAQAITDRIRKGIDTLSAALLEARDRKAFKAMGYPTWEAYVAGELSISLRRSYQLIDREIVTRELSEVAGEKVQHVAQISSRAASEIKQKLPEVKAEIRQRIDQGERPAKAVEVAVAAAREAKAAEKQEHIRQRDEAREALPEPVKAQQEAKRAAIAEATKPQANVDHDALLAEMEELREANASLEQEVARLKAENQKFAEMKALFDKGGFEEVIKAKDAVIAAQATRIERESGDKVAYMRSADAWRKRAEEAGWSDEVVFDIPGRAANG
jgi:hypothetical protein